MSVFSTIDRIALIALINALERGRLCSPFSEVNLSPYLPNLVVKAVSLELNNLVKNGMTQPQLVYLLRCIFEERNQNSSSDKAIELLQQQPRALPASGERREECERV
ncbi:MAG: hypothetical protein HC890_02410 [Chloroflexaceae bacterium]|nr:hypothetical protein [Chloroflexaceae bacterium]